MKRKTKSLNSAHDTFNANVLQFIEDWGAMGIGPRDLYTYTLPTPIGDLRISLHGSWIATNFNNHWAAAVYFRQLWSNGKWNWLYDDDEGTLTNDGCFTDFCQALIRLMNFKPDAEFWRKAREKKAEHERQRAEQEERATRTYSRQCGKLQMALVYEREEKGRPIYYADIWGHGARWRGEVQGPKGMSREPADIDRIAATALAEATKPAKPDAADWQRRIPEGVSNAAERNASGFVIGRSECRPDPIAA